MTYLRQKKTEAAYTIGIIGLGYVGHAILRGFQGYKTLYNIHWYDIADEPLGVKTDSNNVMPYRSYNEQLLVERCDVIFICVPTPMAADMGSCDTSIVEGVVSRINTLIVSIREKSAAHGPWIPPIVVIKSTLPPGTTKILHKKYTEMINLVYNPEFLTEANYIDDFANQDNIILGGHGSNIVERICRYRFNKGVTYLVTDSTTAEMIKYMRNVFLAVKVSFANEMQQLCSTMNVDYDKVAYGTSLDKRIGDSHLTVPGHDGHLGFGGSCLPKDINALLSVAEKHQLDMFTVEGAWKTNIAVRPERDWEDLKGRAVKQ